MKLMIPLPIGAKAPEFALMDGKGVLVSLGDLVAKGRTLLIFYPADWGFVCRTEIVAFRDLQPQFDAMDIQLVGLSYNDTISHGLWGEHLKLRFPLLSDRDMAVAKAYGVYDDKEDSFNKDRSERALFLVDQRRTIVWSWVASNPWLEPEYDEVLSAAQNKPREEQRSGEATPAEPIANN